MLIEKGRSNKTDSKILRKRGQKKGTDLFLKINLSPFSLFLTLTLGMEN